MTKRNSQERNPLDAQQVAEWLLENPDFFQQHEMLLDHLSLPHPQTGSSISLLERLV